MRLSQVMLILCRVNPIAHVHEMQVPNLFSTRDIAGLGLYARTRDDLSVEFASLHVDAVLANGHAQILHREHSPALSTASATTAVPSPRSAKWCVLASVFLSLGRAALAAFCTSGSHSEPCGSSQTRERVVRGRVGAPDARVLVRVRGDVCDELLGCQSEQARQATIGLRWWGEAGECEVVVCDRVGDEGCVVVHFAEELAQAGVFLLWDARLEDGFGVHCFGAVLWWGYDGRACVRA